MEFRGKGMHVCNDIRLKGLFVVHELVGVAKCSSMVEGRTNDQRKLMNTLLSAIANTI